MRSSGNGLAGELVDYRIHEVLQAVGRIQGQEGTVAKVYSRGCSIRELSSLESTVLHIEKNRRDTYDTIIGIDLGTSTTVSGCISGMESRSSCSIFDGKEVTPSVVGLDDSGKRDRGGEGGGALLLAPGRTVREVKRLIGTAERSRWEKGLFPCRDLS